MGIKRRIAGATAVLAAAGIAASAAAGAQRADPGITKTQVTIGGTFPMTGVASLYKTIPLAMQAYFAYVNARGGVNGRKIDFLIRDDAYNPAQTVPLTQQLVEQDKVFAIVGSLGTAPILATWGYLNQQKVPQVFVATGDSYWGNCQRKACLGMKHPYTMGWLPTYPAESRMYGRYIAKNLPNAKIGIVYQNDAFGKNYIAGLVQGLGAKKNLIVDQEGFNATDTSVAQQILALKAKGCDTLFVVATPSQAIASLVTATKVGWSPATFVVSVGANRVVMLAAAKAGANLDGVMSATYVASQTTQPDLPGMKLGRSIIARYAPELLGNWDAGDLNLVYGLGTAWTFVYALQNAGKNPTRASLETALHSMDTTKNPFVYPGIRITTTPTDGFPLEQEIMQRWSGGPTGDWHPLGKLQNVGH